MVALPKSKSGGQDLLAAYTDTFGAALRQSRSLVALRAAKVDAELAYRARGAFLASMNHELRTPLNAITGFAGLLQATPLETLTTERRDEYLGYILESAELLLSHIDMVLEVAAAESGGAKLARCAFDLRDVLRQATAEWVTDGRLQTDIPRTVPLVDADPDKVTTALSHLLNFIGRDEATQDVRLSVRTGLAGKSASFVYVALEARSVVIPEDDMRDSQRIFQQIHDGLDRKFDLNRLGLPIARSIIELNRGKFSVKSTADTGTLIRFALPLAAEEHQATQAQVAS